MKTTRNQRILACLGLAGLTLGCCLANGDVLELKNGQLLNGKYSGGSSSTVRFETGKGLEVIQTSQIIALTFTSGGSAAASASAAPAAQAAPTAAAQPSAATSQPTAAPAQPAKVTLPSGTTLLVRMMSSVSSQNPPGTKFATKLEYDLRANNVVAVKAGTTIHGTVRSATRARRVAGQASLDIRLTEMVIDGRPVPIATGGHQEASERAIRDAARGAAGGAAIGAIAGDAGQGAAIGATVGALKRGNDITIPPGTMLEFRLASPATVTPGAK